MQWRVGVTTCWARAQRAWGAISTQSVAVFRSYASLVFSSDSSVGLMLLGASFFEPVAGAAGLMAVLGAMGAVNLLGYRRDLSQSGFFGANAVLCGLAVGHGRDPSGSLLALALLLGTMASLLMAVLSELFARLARLPVLALPFVMTTTLLWPALNLSQHPIAQGRFSAIPDLPWHLPRLCEFALRSAGSIVFQPSTAAGLLVMIAIVAGSRVALAYGLLGVGMTLGVASRFYPLANSVWIDVAGYNALLTSMALGCIFYVPSKSSLAWSLVGSTLAVLLSLAIGPIAEKLGWPVFAWPFVIVTLTLLRALGLKHPKRSPHPPLLAASPESNMSYVRMLAARFGLPGVTKVQLPVKGTWTVSQGVDGEHTHQGPWRYALDFEVTDDNGFPFRDQGFDAEDYYCFGESVHAPLSGTVVLEYAEHVDNPPGSQDLRYPFGNVVVIQHGESLFSVLAHLQRHSIVVKAGQTVVAGELIGRCGSSGRSPRPHLHFQLQTEPSIGGSTLPFELSHYAVARGDRAEYVPFGVPSVGDRIAGGVTHMTPELPMLLAGTEFELTCIRNTSRPMRSEISLIGERSIRDLTSGERLYFSTLDGVTTFTTLSARSGSPLAALALAMPRVPPFEGSVTAAERVPVEWILPTWGRVVNDILRIFGMDAQLVGTSRVERSENAITSKTTYGLSWFGRIWTRYVASVRVAGDRVVDLSLARGNGLVLQRLDANGSGRIRARRLLVTPGLGWRVLAIPTIALVAGLSLLLSSNQVTAKAQRPVTNPLAASYRLEAAGDLAHAIDAAAEAVIQQPQQYFPILRLAYLEYSAKRFARAASHYSAAAELAPKTLEAQIGLLLSRIGENQYEPALEVAGKILEIDPHNYTAHSRKAWALYQLHRYAKAVDEYTAVLELYPGDIEMRLGRAYALSGAKRQVEAGMEFREVLRRVPDDRRAKTALGMP